MQRFFAAAAVSIMATGVNAEDFFESGSVDVLTNDDWETHIEANKRVLTMFFAPWCGHCKNMKPEFSAAAADMQYKKMSFAAVDCTDNQDTCGKYDVKGYPTLKFFEDGEASEYTGGRTKGDFVKWADDKLGDEAEDFAGVDFKKLKTKELKRILLARGVNIAGLTEKKEFVSLAEKNHHLPTGAAAKKKKKKNQKSSLVNGRSFAQERRWKAAKAAAEEGFGDDSGEIAFTIDDEWKAFRTAHPKSFVMFHAPWCGHCKTMKPEFIAASKDAKKTDPDVQFAAVECDTNPEICRSEGASSYPTLKFYDAADSKGELFNGGRTAKGMKTWFVKKFHPDDYTKEPFVNDETKWETSGAVLHLTDDHFETYRTTAPKMLVMFYAPWCGHCKAMKGDFAEASTQASDSEMAFVAVDCTVETMVCGKFGVQGYPTVKYFDSADGAGEDYNGGRDLDALVAFANEKGGAASAEYKEEL